MGYNKKTARFLLPSKLLRYWRLELPYTLNHCLPRESYKNVCVIFFKFFAKAISASRRGFMRGLIAPDYHARGQ